MVPDRRRVQGDQRDGGGTGGHGQGHPGPGAFLMVGTVTFCGHTIFRVSRLMRGDHDAVFERQVFELVRL